MSVLPLAAAGLVAMLGAAWALYFYRADGGDLREAQLAGAKRTAALLLVAAAAGFLATFAAPHALAARLLRSGFEAAMVGAIADWIAVSALFRRIWLVGESDVIARQKDGIAGELAHFVQDKFLDADSLAALIRKHDLGQGVADWLVQEANTQYLAGFLRKTVGGFLHMVEEDRVQQLLKDATRTVMGEVDLSRSAGQVLETLTADGRHQALLDQLIVKIAEAANRQETRDAIAEKIVQWLRSEHRFKQLVLPTDWLGTKGSEIVAASLDTYLREVQADRGHALRVAFDRQVATLVARLRDDPAMHAKAEEIKAYLLNDDHLARYASALWTALSDWLRREVESPDSLLHANLAAAARWLGRELARDPALRRTLNAQLEAAARTAAPEFALFLTHHIRDTVRAWDAREMSHQVELALGARLQKIRWNGTAMGFVIGVGLFLAGRGVDRWLVG